MRWLAHPRRGEENDVPVVEKSALGARAARRDRDRRSGAARSISRRWRKVIGYVLRLQGKLPARAN
jgi:hypothetical protein